MTDQLVSHTIRQYNTLGQYARAARQQLGMTQAAVAEGTDLSRQAVWSIENEESSPYFHSAVILLKFFRERGIPPINIYSLSQ